MKTVTLPITTLETIIEGLEDAIKVCYNVDYKSDDTEKSPEFATRYSRAAMTHAIVDLNNILNK